MATVLVASLVAGGIWLWPAGADIDANGWHLVGSSGEPAFETNVGDIRDLSGIDYNHVSYRKTGDVVDFRGVVGPTSSDGVPQPMHTVGMTNVLFGVSGDDAPGAFGVKLFTLPCGYRPEHISVEATASSDIFGKNWASGGIIVMPNGDVYGATYSSPFYSSTGSTSLQLSFVLEGAHISADSTASCTDADGITTTTEAP